LALLKISKFSDTDIPKGRFIWQVNKTRFVVLIIPLVSIVVETILMGLASIVWISGRGPALPVAELMRTSLLGGKGGGGKGKGEAGSKDVGIAVVMVAGSVTGSGLELNL
jgi:hypothetical protein